MEKGNKDALEALKFAIKFEKDGYCFYIKASKKTKNLVGREMFKYIAEEEKRHVEKVKSIYEKLKKSDEWPKTSKMNSGKKKTISFENIFTKVKGEIIKILMVDSGDVEALKIAKEMEVEGYKFYRKRAEQTDNPLEKAFYEELVKEESNHYEILENTYEYLSNPADWFSNKERPIYEG
ncbi:MAG: hypothetical protein A2W05_04535 [Candidatus Schekmanbacteria bacterium RBG_16_38_10]|uniref:Rubrerythrin diiron-binding domain-containing protein n=1 Tax=Candidatus Schekmanbacteria bacterium RBG_16_38_10 TaxID=1817879 RepID=A0A1F7RY12_9BACT|nr:MAG: hypothetical protein A2W05_04535 [Candidatus Schekmanbacteria bacterium RBG_16_38_10]